MVVRASRFARWRRRPGEAWYWLRCAVWNRYNVVRIKTLPPTWTDADERLLHANFAILCEVIELEEIFEHTSAEGDPKEVDSWAWALAEMKDLYDWWKIVRPERELEHDKRLMAWHALYTRDRDSYSQKNPGWRTTDNPKVQRLSPPASFESDETRAAWALSDEHSDEVRGDDDDAMLCRLIKVRRYLWT